MKSWEMQCEDCKENIIRKVPHQLRCLKCSCEYRKSSKKVKEFKEFQKQCIQCKENFITHYHKAKYCGDKCREKENNIRINKNWLKSVPRKQDPSMNDRIEYSRVSKKPTQWMKKFNACRG